MQFFLPTTLVTSKNTLLEKPLKATKNNPLVLFVGDVGYILSNRYIIVKEFNVSIFSESESELLPPDLIINEFRWSCIIQSHTVTINIILQRTKWKMFERIILDVYNFSV